MNVNSTSNLTTESADCLAPNVFEQAAAAGRGSLTQRQLYTLDSLRNSMDSDKFNLFREQAGIAPYTPNYKLSKRRAARLIDCILKAQAGDG